MSLADWSGIATPAANALTDAAAGPVSVSGLLRAVPWVAPAVLIAATVIPWFVSDRRLKRRIYWTGWVVGALLGAIALGDRTGRETVPANFLWLGLFGVVLAIRAGPYLKINGRIIAFSSLDRRPDDDAGAEPDAGAALPPLTADEARATTFPGPRLGQRGYHPGQVDALRDRIVATLERRDAVTADDVDSVAFTSSPPLVRGYRPDVVDEFLYRAAQALSRQEGRIPCHRRLLDRRRGDGRRSGLRGGVGASTGGWPRSRSPCWPPADAPPHRPADAPLHPRRRSFGPPGSRRLPLLAQPRSRRTIPVSVRGSLPSSS